MDEEEKDRMLFESHQALLGIPGTDDKGLVGDVKDMKADLRALNGKVRRNEVRSKVNQGMGGLFLVGLGWIGKHIGLW